jgi:structure-specific endonuclease subunit SLX1
MIVYGFPSKIHALQFEWAWQKPLLSRHVKSVPNDDRIKSLIIENHKRGANWMLTKMWAAQMLLNTIPFSLLPLKLRFVIPNLQALFMEHTSLPRQMTTSVGSIEDLMRENKLLGSENYNTVLKGSSSN